MSAHSSVHLDLAGLDVDGVLGVMHPDGRVGFRIADGDATVWVGGTPDDFKRFAVDVAALAERAEELAVSPSPGVETAKADDAPTLSATSCDPDASTADVGLADCEAAR